MNQLEYINNLNLNDILSLNINDLYNIITKLDLKVLNNPLFNELNNIHNTLLSNYITITDKYDNIIKINNELEQKIILYEQKYKKIKNINNKINT